MSTTPTLSQRLKALRAGEPKDIVHDWDFCHLSLQQLAETKLGFGKTHATKTFETVWLNRPAYVQWFLDHESMLSKKQQHRMFLHYCECMIDHAELRGTKVPAQSQGTVAEEFAVLDTAELDVWDTVDAELMDPAKLQETKVPAQSQGILAEELDLKAILKRVEDLEAKVVQLGKALNLATAKWGSPKWGSSAST